MNTRQLCTFWVGELYFGVEVEKVQEVNRFQQVTRLPVAPPEVAGLINLRGQIVTAIDLRQRLGLAASDDGEHPMNVVLRTEGGVVSLLVDEIGEVLEVANDLHEPTPNTIDGQIKDVIRGVYKLPEQLLLVLDCELALQFTTCS